MSDTPDTSAAFEAEANEVDKDARIAELEAKLDSQDREKETDTENKDSDAVEGELVVADDDDEAIEPEEIEVDGRTWHYFTPEEGQFMVFSMASSQARGLTNEKRMRRLYGFLENLFTDDDFEEALHLVEDRHTDFNFADLMNIVTKIAEKVGDEARANGPKNRAERRAVARGKKTA